MRGGGASPVVVRVLVLALGQCHEIGLTGHGSVGGLVLAGGGRCREYHRQGEAYASACHHQCVRVCVCVCPDRGSARFERHAACKPAPPHRRRAGGKGHREWWFALGRKYLGKAMPFAPPSTIAFRLLLVLIDDAGREDLTRYLAKGCTEVGCNLWVTVHHID